MISTTTPPIKAITPPRSFSAGIVIALAVVVIALVTLGKPFIEIPWLVNGAAHAVRSIDTQLFDGFDRPNYWYAPWTNSLGNIALFMPLAAGIYARSKSFFAAVGASIAASLGIEITQYIFALGYSDVDDLFFNTIGGVLGAGAMAIIPKSEHPGLMRLTGILLTMLLAGMAVLGLNFHI